MPSKKRHSKQCDWKMLNFDHYVLFQLAQSGGQTMLYLGKKWKLVVLMVNRNKHMKITDIPFPFAQYLYTAYENSTDHHKLMTKVEGNTSRCISYFYLCCMIFFSIFLQYELEKIQMPWSIILQRSSFFVFCHFSALLVFFNLLGQILGYLQNYCTQWIIQTV